MKSPDFYKGRGQTYLKHYVLEHYLETVALHIGYARNEFTYVDCFSGPWRNESDDLADTSSRIALDKLNYVRRVLAQHQKQPVIRAIFIEKDRDSFTALERVLEAHCGEIQTTALPGNFEDNIPEILQKLGTGFAFCFIDPTGWTLGMDRIGPLLRHHPGEVLINFMYDFVNRFLNSRDPATEASLDHFFGTDIWRDLRNHPEREPAIIDLYEKQVRAVGRFKFVTSTRILKPVPERTYFHLIYATRSSKGIEKIRDVEKRLVNEQVQVRRDAQRRDREVHTRQTEIDFTDPPTLSTMAQGERGQQRRKAELLLSQLLNAKPRKYEELLPVILQIPMFSKTDLNDLLSKEQKAGGVTIDGMSPRQRVPGKGCIIRRAKPKSS